MMTGEMRYTADKGVLSNFTVWIGELEAVEHEAGDLEAG